MSPAASLLVGALFAAFIGAALLAMVRHQKARPRWSPTSLRAVMRSMPCVDCGGSIAGHHGYCQAVGGAGLPLVAERDVRQVEATRSPRRPRKAVTP